MKVGVFAVLFAQRPLGEALDYIKATGCDAVEIGAGGYPGNAHCDPAALLKDDNALAASKNEFTSRQLEISALSCHGNPLHPDKSIAEAHDRDFRNTVQLAEKLGVQTVITFSGCPGDSETSQKPNWVTCPWPTDYLDILEWQWRKRSTPYWSEAAAVRRRPRRPRRDRAAPRVRRLSHRVVLAAARDRRRTRSASTSIPPTSSGRAWIRSSASASSATPSSTST